MISFGIADWRVDVRAPEVYRQALLDCLQNEVSAFAPLADASPSRRVAIDIDEAPSPSGEKAGGLAFDVPKIGYRRQIEPRNKTIRISLEKREFTSPGILYHLGVLFPLSYVWREHGSTLIHAGLVAQGSEGILIVGPSGSGKTSLSLALAKSGCRFFSDEHPVLSRKGQEIVGTRFLGVPAIRPRTATHLDRCQLEGVWSEWRGKFCVGLSGLRLAEVSEEVKIRTILFPRYEEGVGLETEREKPFEVFSRLCADDYLCLNGASRHPEEKARHRFHVELLLSLATQARGYTLRYGPRGLESLWNGGTLSL